MIKKLKMHTPASSLSYKLYSTSICIPRSCYHVPTPTRGMMVHAWQTLITRHEPERSWRDQRLDAVACEGALLIPPTLHYVHSAGSGWYGLERRVG